MTSDSSGCCSSTFTNGADAPPSRLATTLGSSTTLSRGIATCPRACGPRRRGPDLPPDVAGAEAFMAAAAWQATRTGDPSVTRRREHEPEQLVEGGGRVRVHGVGVGGRRRGTERQGSVVVVGLRV